MTEGEMVGTTGGSHGGEDVVMGQGESCLSKKMGGSILLHGGSCCMEKGLLNFSWDGLRLDLEKMGRWALPSIVGLSELMGKMLTGKMLTGNGSVGCNGDEKILLLSSSSSSTAVFVCLYAMNGHDLVDRTTTMLPAGPD
ncbi:hypothetical protein ACLOJK_022990 [Asimina triloba]